MISLMGREVEVGLFILTKRMSNSPYILIFITFLIEITAGTFVGNIKALAFNFSIISF